MKRHLLTIAFAVCCALCASAQTTPMTDAQIIAFIQQEQKAGTSQQQISIKLVQKGVSVQRIQELRKKYEKLGGNSTAGATDLVTGTDRMRTQPGITRQPAAPDPAQVQGNTTMRVPGQDKSNLPLDETNPELLQMQNELNGFMPDSTEMLRQQLQALQTGGRKVFGRDIFNNRLLSFEPNMNIATPEDYILGPGDAVFVDIYGVNQLTIDDTISPDGDVNIEGFGPVHVSGMTVARATQRLNEVLGPRFSNSRIRLTVGETRTILVNVMGEVVVPGTYTLSAFATVFHALYMAGGVNDIGTLRDIKVYRGGKLVTSVDIYDYILNGQLGGNVRLADNDVIVVGPYDCLVNVTGKVKRPMFYEMRKDESLGTLMKYTGGFTGDAYTGSVRVVRKAGNAYSVWNVTEFDMGSFLLCDEDSVSVDSVIPRYENTVELRGAARRPGLYQIGGNVTTVRELMTVADGLSDEAFAGHVVLHRRKADRTLEVLSFNLDAVMDGTEPDVTLQNDDVLFIPSKEDSNAALTLKIYGEVYYPGQYQYAEGMTVEDFILQAGGLKETASTQRVTVSRRVTTDPAAQDEANAGGRKKAKKDAMAERGVRAETFEITLQDGFALDGKEGCRLEPYDEVYVGKAPGYSEQVTVEVDGEANYRGTYALKQNNARLSDVVAQAGGVTGDAWVKGARIIRKMDDEEMRRRERQLIDLRVYNLEVVSSSNANVISTRRELVDSLLWAKYVDVDEYVVGIHLDEALDNPGGDYDITLRDGDRLVIPQYEGTVKVSGEVNFPCSTTYKANRSLKSYIRTAGGYTGTGWQKHAYVVYANGTVDRVRCAADVEPGCEIIVPVKPIRTSSNASLWISAISALATAAALIITAIE
ncbi:MAG: SLBB domain-containing protein [Prevotella sp.]|nr:SLBB domain-containing protein [Prevotella sp.]